MRSSLQRCFAPFWRPVEPEPCREKFDAAKHRVEVLECRIAPAAVLDILSGENTSFTGDGTSDNTTVFVVGGGFTGFYNSGGLTSPDVDGVNVIQFSGTEIHVLHTLIDGGMLTMTGGGGTDDILFNASLPGFHGLSADYDTVQTLPALTIGSGGISIHASASTSDLVINGNITVDSGAATFMAGRSVLITSGADIVAGSGAVTVTLNADRDGNSSGGVFINPGGTSITTNGGDFIIGGGATPASTPVFGPTDKAIYIDAATISTGAGNISVRGQGGTTSGSGAAIGIDITNGTSFSTTSGNITFVGTGGAVTDNFTSGVSLFNGSSLSTVTGAISLTGTTNGTGTNAYGVKIQQNSFVAATGNGSIAINGTGGAGASGAANEGVALFDNADVTSAGSGTIAITATGGANSHAFSTGSGSNDITIGGGSATGAITIAANSISINAPNTTIQTTGTATLRQTTNGTAIVVGSTNGVGATLNLSDAELDSVNAGLLQIGDSNSGAISQSGAVSLAGAVSFTTGANTITLTDASNDFNGAVSLANSGANLVQLTTVDQVDLGNVAVGGDLTLISGDFVSDSGTIVVPGTLTVTAGTVPSPKDVTLDGVSNNFGTVVIARGNNVTLSDTNAIVLGASTVSAALTVTTAGAITQSGALSVTGVATLEAGSGNNITLNNASNNFSTVSIVTGNTVNLVDANALILGASSVSSSLTVSTSGAITQSDGITVGGTLTVGAGASNNITLDHVDNAFSAVAVPSGSAVSLRSDIGFNIGATTIGTSLTVESASTITQSAALAGGTLALTKAGAGVFILSSANTYGGATTINGGTLQVDGSLSASANAVAVNNGGTLAGSGTISRAVNVANGGSIAPGSSTAILNTGAVAFSSSSTFNIEVDGTTPGTGFDQLNVSGAVTLTGATLNLSGTHTPIAGEQFTIIANDSGDAITGTFTGLAEGATITNFLGSGLDVTISYVGGTGNDVVLTVFDPASTTLIFEGGGDIYIQDVGTASNDNLVITIDGTNLRITDLSNAIGAGLGASQVNANTVEIPLASFTGALHIATDGGNDTLTLNLANGDFINAAGISYDGGAGGNDELVINGDGQGTVTYNYTNANDGNIVMSNFGTVTYVGLEPITNDGTADDIIFNLPAGPNAVTLADDSISNTLSRLSGATFETTDFANPTGSITINRGNASDTITVDALPDFNADLIIGSGASPFASITFTGAITLAAGKSLTADASGTISLSGANADLATSGAGTITLTSARDITLASGSSLTVVNGNVTLSANQQMTPTAGDFIGIQVGGTITTSGTGDLILSGRGGDDVSTSDHDGIRIVSTGLIQSTATGATAGTITLMGAGGSGTSNSKGIYVQGPISTVSGDILLTGTGGATAGDNSKGIHTTPTGSITSTGTGANAGDITLVGYGNATTAGLFADGVGLPGGSLTSVDGDISITGTSYLNNNVGIRLGVMANPVTIQATGDGAITFTGIGSPSATLEDIYTQHAGNIFGAVGGTGGVTFNADTINLSLGTVQNAGTVTIQPTTAGTTTSLGGSSTLDLTDAELDNITATNIVFGNGTSGAMTIGSSITRASATNLTLNAGANTVTFTGGGGINAAGGTVTFNSGAITGSTGTEVTSSGGTLVLNTTGAVSIDTAVANLGASTVTTGALSINNTGNLTVSGAVSFTSTLSLASSGTLTIGANLSKASGGAATATLSAANGVLFNTGTSLVSSSGAMAVVLNGDSDANSAGPVVLNTGTSITSNGGNITIGGGADPSTTAAFGSTGVSNPGVRLLGTLTAGGGNVSVRGNGLNSVAGATGVELTGAITTSGAGTVTIDGTGGTGAANVGVQLTNGSITSTGSGAITITGAGASGAAGVSTATGTNTIGGASHTGAITINTDSISLANHNIQTTGTVTIQPVTNSTTVSLNGASTLDLTTAELSGISAATLVIGSATGTGAISVATTNLGGTNYNLTLRGGAATFTGGITLAASKTATFNTAGITGSGGTDVTSSGGTLVLNTTGAVTMQTALANLGASSVSGGAVSVTNSGNFLVSGAVSFTSDLTLASSGTLTLGANLSKTTGGASNTLLQAVNGIVFNAGVALASTSGAMNVTLNSDTDANSQGPVLLNTTSSITSNGGNVTIGGGANPATTAAFGSSVSEYGVRILGSINAGAGDVSIRGQSLATPAAAAHGVDISTGAGVTGNNITIVGTGGSSAAQATSGVNITRAITATGNISIIGSTAGSLNGSSRGVFIQNTSVSTTGAAATIAIDGTAGGGNNAGVELNNSGNVTSTGSGAITIDATGSGTSAAFLTGTGTNRIGFNGITPYSGAVTLTADTVALVNHNITTSNNVTIRPETLSTTISLNGASTLDLTTAELSGISAATLIVGATGGTGAIGIGSAGQLALSSTNYNLTLNGGAVTFSGAVSPIIQLSSNKTFTFNTGAITGAGGAVSDVQSTNGTLVLNTTGAVTMRTTLGNFGASTISGGAVSVTNTTSFTVSGAVTNSSPLTLSTANANTDLTVNGSITGTGADISLNAVRTITVNQSVTTNGSGAISLSGNAGVGARNIIIDAAATVSTVNGALSIDADQGAGVAGVFSGVSVAGTVSVSGSGTLTVAGRGGNTSGANAGLIVTGDIIAGTTGTATITGIGGANAAAGNHGVRVSGTGSSIASNGASLQITGSSNGTGAGTASHGVSLDSGAAISAGGAGSVTISGTGSAGTGGGNTGVFLGTSSATITTNGGAIGITATAGGGTSTAFDLSDATASITTATNGGNITLNANSMNLVGTVSAHASNTAALLPTTAGQVINLGAADSAGVLGLTDAELDQVTGGTIAIGSAANTGGITLSAAMTQGAKNFTLATGAGISFGANNFTTTGNVTLTADADTNGTGAISSTSGVISANTLGATAAAGITLNTTVSSLSASNSTTGNIVIVESDSVTVTGLATLAGGGSISLSTTSGSINATGAISANGAGNVTIAAGGTGTLSTTTVSSGSGNIALSTNNGALTTSGAVTTTSTGTIGLTAGGAGNTLTVGAGVSSGSGAISLTADAMALNGSANSIASTGALSVTPVTASTSIGLGTGSTGTLNLSGAEIATFADGFSSITFGASAGSHAIDIDNNGTLTFNDPVTIRTGSVGGSISLASDTPLVGAGNASITLTSAGAVTLNNSITTANQNIAVNFGQAGGAVNITVGVLNAGAGVATVTGGTGANIITLTSTANTLSVVGGGGSDTLVAPNTVNTWNLSANTLNTNVTHSGITTLQGGSSSDTFNINASRTQNLRGGGGTDDFVLSVGVTLTGSVDGEAGTDTLNLSAVAAAPTISGAGSVDGVAGTISPALITAGFDNINTLSGTGTFTGANATSTWAVGSTVTYTTGSNTVTLTGYTALQGGTAVDTFNITNGHSITTISGGAGADIFNASYSGGSPVPGGGLTLNGENDGDTLSLSGTTATTVTHDFTNNTDGAVTVDAGSALNYTGMETTTDTLGAANRIFNFNGGTETISLTDGGVAAMTIDSTLSSALTFANPTTSITVNGGTGDDTINVTSMDAAYAGSLTINGGAATDNVTLGSGLPTLSALTSTSETLAALPALTIGAGGLNLTASAGAITQSGALSVTGTTTLNATGITLAHASNNFVGAVTATSTGSGAAGDVSINDSTGGITIAAITAANADSVSVSAAGGGNISITGTISAIAATTVGITATGGGDINLTGVISAAASAATLSGDAISLGGSITADTLGLTAASTITQSAGSLTTTGAVTTSSAGDQTLTSTTNSIAAFIATNTLAGGDIVVENGFDGFQIGPITNNDGPVTIDNNNAGTNAATIAGTVNSGGTAVGDVLISTTGLLTVNAPVITTGGSGGVLTFAGNITVNAAPVIGGGDITLQGGGGDLTINANLSFNTSFTLTSQDNVIINATVATTGGSSDLTIIGDSDLDGDGGVYISDDGFVNSSRDVTITGSDLASLGIGFADQAVRIDADTDTITPGVQVQAVRNITINSSSAAPANVTALAGYVRNTNTGPTVGNIEFTGPVDIIDNTAFVQAGGAGSVLFDATVNSIGAYDLKLQATLGNINFLAAVGNTDPLGDVTVVNAGNVTTLSTFEAASFTITNAAGTVTLGDTVTVSAATGDALSIKAVTLVADAINATGGGNILLETDNITLGDDVSGAGELTLRPITATRSIGVNGAGSFSLDTAEIENLLDGFTLITIGRTNGSGAITTSGATFVDAMKFLTPTGAMSVNGPVATTGTASSIEIQAKTLNLNVDSAGDHALATQAAAITVSNTNIVLLTDTSISTSTGAAGGDVLLRATINGAFDFAVDAFSDAAGGDVTLRGVLANTPPFQSIGGSTRLTAFTVDANNIDTEPMTYTNGPQEYNAATLITTRGGAHSANTGSVTYNGTLNPLANLRVAGTDLVFTGPVLNPSLNTTAALTLTATGEVRFEDNVGITGLAVPQPLNYITIDKAALVSVNGELRTLGALTITAGEIDFTGGADTVIATAVNLFPATITQNVNLGSVAENPSSPELELSADDIAALGSGISQITIGRLDSTGTLSVDGAVTFESTAQLRTGQKGTAIVDINAPVIATGSASLFINGALIKLGADVTSDAGEIIFTHQHLSRGGKMTVDADVTVTSTSGDIYLQTTTTLTDHLTLISTSGDVFINGGVTSTNTSDFSISAPSGNVTFAHAIGNGKATARVGHVQVDSGGITTLLKVDANSIETDAAGTTVLKSNVMSWQAAGIQFNDPVTMGASVNIVVEAKNSGAVDFFSTLQTASAARAITIRSASGNITMHDAVGTGVTPFKTLTITSLTGDLVLDGTVNAAAVTLKADSIDANAAITSSGNQSFTTTGTSGNIELDALTAGGTLKIASKREITNTGAWSISGRATLGTTTTNASDFITVTGSGNNFGDLIINGRNAEIETDGDLKIAGGKILRVGSLAGFTMLTSHNGDILQTAGFETWRLAAAAPSGSITFAIGSLKLTALDLLNAAGDITIVRGGPGNLLITDDISAGGDVVIVGNYGTSKANVDNTAGSNPISAGGRLLIYAYDESVSLGLLGGISAPTHDPLGIRYSNDPLAQGHPLNIPGTGDLFIFVRP